MRPNPWQDRMVGPRGLRQRRVRAGNRMESTSTRWVNLGEPASPAEAAALARFRELLRDDGATFAWSNLTFIDTSGRTAEVDVLLLSRVGMFVVELKGWHGTISGDQQNWVVTTTSGQQVRHAKNPLFLADAKAKRLASLLKAVAPRGAERVVPFIGAKVVLHGEDSRIELSEAASSHLLALDGYRVNGLNPSATLSAFVATPPANPRHVISADDARAIAALVAEAGFVPTPRTRTVGQYTLTSEDALAVGTGWHDELAEHPAMPGMTRRIRIFDIPPGTALEDRQEIERTAQRELSLTRGIRHPGIEAPVDLVRSDLGPALIFEYDPDAIPLDRYLAQRGDSLGYDARLGLVRQIAEVVAYAHSRRLTHRALSPSRVWISPGDGAPQVRIRDWMTGRRTGTSARSTMTVLSGGITDPARLVEQDQWFYLAPESLRGGANLPPVPLDVYGLGALAYLAFTGEQPSANVAELQRRIQAGTGLDAAAVSPALPDAVVALVREASSPGELERPATVQDFLDALTAVQAQTTTEVAPSSSIPSRHPRARSSPDGSRCARAAAAAPPAPPCSWTTSPRTARAWSSSSPATCPPASGSTSRPTCCAASTTRASSGSSRGRWTSTAAAPSSSPTPARPPSRTGSRTRAAPPSSSSRTMAATFWRPSSTSSPRASSTATSSPRTSASLPTAALASPG
ncbi:protein kinase [Georgenia subflava]|uniref:Protein kinase n=1 Tax=Georgenia subflava TaxID=1622177 RepID=A0A6N7EB96_9MICO|nr:protein kinase [Georgenia subflava]